MDNKTFKLNYTAVPHGTESTDLIFYKTISDIYENIWSEFNEENKKFILVTDDKIASLETTKNFIEQVKNKNFPVVILPTGEENKTMENVLTILTKALESGFTRSSTFLALGGGVISDMTAFASSLFKRGARLQIIPTTLLSMSDAAIGGKTGCDFGEYKNMLGTFYPAEKIHFCAEYLSSLSEKEFYSGLAEVIKTAMLYDKVLFTKLIENSDKVKEHNMDFLSEAIEHCAMAKAKIVQMDVTEQNIRKQLNLGHTFAHALESVAGFGVIPHGHAVAWGLSRAIQLSLNEKLCSEEYFQTIEKLLNNYGYCTKKIPDEVKHINNIQEKLLSAMHQDKKNNADEICVILQSGFCSTVITKIDENSIKNVL